MRMTINKVKLPIIILSFLIYLLLFLFPTYLLSPLANIEDDKAKARHLNELQIRTFNKSFKPNLPMGNHSSPEV